jgi:hypothetical protein
MMVQLCPGDNMSMDEKNKSSLKVECYAGYRGEETPLRFYLGKRCIEVQEVLDRWLDPAYRYFKLRGNDNSIYILRHLIDEDRWEMTLFDSSTRNETRLSST